MLAFVYNIFFLFSEGGKSGGGFVEFYNRYLNIPGFEFWKFLNLAIFVGLMIYLLKKPLGEAFKVKREAIRAELIKAEEEKKAALAKLTSAEARLASLDAEKESVLKKAKDEAEAEKKRLAEQTANEIGKMQEQTAGEINRLAQLTRIELTRFSAEESIRLAEEKLRSQIDAKVDANLVKSGIQAIGGLN
jgi:F-type H+-transporting ATPase subunit b